MATLSARRIFRITPGKRSRRLQTMGNTSSSYAISSSSPWFTHGLDSPAFETIAERNGYEIRKYQSSKWVGTQVKSRSCQEATDVGFRYLFNYIKGENEVSQKIPMTTPVAIKVEPSQSPACDNTFTTCFYIPAEFQADAPAPTNPIISFYDYPELTIYVISYSGFTSDDKLFKHAIQLGTLLDRDGVDYVKEHYFYCGYDPPYRLFNRHNEVWFVAKNEQDN